jgi:DNA-binding transcriptional MocR family regulator
LILPDSLADDVAAAAADTYITPSLVSQATVFEFITRGSFERHLEELRGALRTRRDAMLAAIARHLPGATTTTPQGGLFVWVELPGSPDGRALLARAEGVTAVAGSEFSAMSSFLRLNYAAVPPEQIELGVQRIAAALAAA